MWTEERDDRALLRELSRDIIADLAPEELDAFDMLLEDYFTRPHPPRELDGLPPRLSAVAPAVVGAVLSLLLIEIQAKAHFRVDEMVRAGLRGLIRASAQPNQDLRLRANHEGEPWTLTMLLYLYTLPVRITVGLADIYHAAFNTSRSYGLCEEQAELLTLAVITRLFRGATVR